jgi:hypothetical protein
LPPVVFFAPWSWETCFSRSLLISLDHSLSLSNDSGRAIMNRLGLKQDKMNNNSISNLGYRLGARR